MGPWIPVMKDGKLYGRGGADDGYALFSSILAINAIREQNISLPRILILIEFCEENYGVTFPMMTKVKVKGINKHPLYQFLTQKAKNNYKDSRVTWNFQKYLINRDGMVEKIISPKARPDSEEVISWIINGE